MVNINHGQRNFITTSKQKVGLVYIPFLAEPSAYNKTPIETAPMGWMHGITYPISETILLT